MVFETSRLVLRGFEESDWEAVHEYVADPAFLEYMPWDMPDEAFTRQLVRHMSKGKEARPPHCDFAVVCKSDHRLIGWCALIIAHDDWKQAELGYAYHPGYWARGYATEAAQLVVNYGFTEMKLHRLFATTRPGNVGSWRVLEKVGFRKEGLLLEHRWIRDSWQDSYLYAILDREWKAGQ